MQANQPRKIDRRSFLAGSAGTVAALSMAKAAYADEATDTDISWDLQTEVLVCGFGGSGAVAAVTAHEEGAQVLILEKAAHTGGGVSGVSGANTCTVIDADKAFDYVKECCQGLTSDEVIRAWANEGATLTSWLDDHGIGYGDRGDSVGFTAMTGGDDQIVRLVTLADPNDQSRAGGNYFME